MVVNVIAKLTRGYQSDTTIRRLVDNVDWYLLPVFNADGYVHTWTMDRMWRKNRSVERCTGASVYGGLRQCCRGVDLNRNFDWYFISA